jgi:hypothetical protein
MLVITIETGIEAASAISKSFHLYYVPFTRFFFLDCKNRWCRKNISTDFLNQCNEAYSAGTFRTIYLSVRKCRVTGSLIHRTLDGVGAVQTAIRPQNPISSYFFFFLAA